MSLVVAWSRADTTDETAEAILQYVLFRLELDGHTTAIIGPDAVDEAGLIGEADAVVLLADSGDALKFDQWLKLAGAGAPVLLLSTADDGQAGLPERTIFSAKIDLNDLGINDCGASFSGPSERALRIAIRQIASFLQTAHFQQIDDVA